MCACVPFSDGHTTQSSAFFTLHFYENIRIGDERRRRRRRKKEKTNLEEGK